MKPAPTWAPISICPLRWSRSAPTRSRATYNIQYIVLESPTAPTLGENVFAGCDYLYDIDLNAHGTRQEMQQWQAYVDALGLPCRVWRAQDPTAQSPEKGAYQYENRVLTEYTGTKTRIHPHLTVSKEPVVGLGDGVFKDSQTIEYFSVAHNDEFTTIGAEAFMNSSLREVDLFDSVTDHRRAGVRKLRAAGSADAARFADHHRRGCAGRPDRAQKAGDQVRSRAHSRGRIRQYAQSERSDRRERRCPGAYVRGQRRDRPYAGRGRDRNRRERLCGYTLSAPT